MFRTAARSTIAALTVAVALTAVASASAEVRQASQDDPSGDATLVASSFSGPALRLLDVRAVSVRYDSSTGTIDVAFAGDLPNVSHSGISYTLTLAGTSDAHSPCGTGSGESFALQAWSGANTAGSPTGSVAAPDGFTGSTWTDAVGGSGLGFHAQGPSLVGRDLRCVVAVSATRTAAGFVGGSLDDVASFCLVADCLTPVSTGVGSSVPPAPVAPVAQAIDAATTVVAPVGPAKHGVDGVTASARAAKPDVEPLGSASDALSALYRTGLRAALTCPGHCRASARLTRGGKVVAKAAIVHKRPGHKAALRLRAVKARGGGKRLAAGTYRLRVTVIDSSGHKTTISRLLELG